MQTVFHSGENLALKRNHMLKKADRETSTYECFASLFFSPHCQCFPQLHSVSVKLLSAGTQQRRGLVLNTSSLWSIHMAYHFPSCLITAMALCPDLKLPVELPIQPPFCSHIKPNILPFPNKLLQPNSLANPPRTQMKSVKVCPLYKRVPALLHKSFLDHVQKIADPTPAGCQMYLPSWEISPPVLV